MHNYRPQSALHSTLNGEGYLVNQPTGATYISHLINLLEAGLQEGLEGNTVRGNHSNKSKNYTHVHI